MSQIAVGQFALKTHKGFLLVTSGNFRMDGTNVADPASQFFLNTSKPSNTVAFGDTITISNQGAFLSYEIAPDKTPISLVFGARTRDKSFAFDVEQAPRSKAIKLTDDVPFVLKYRIKGLPKGIDYYLAFGEADNPSFTREKSKAIVLRKYFAARRGLHVVALPIYLPSAISSIKKVFNELDYPNIELSWLTAFGGTDNARTLAEKILARGGSVHFTQALFFDKKNLDVKNPRYRDNLMESFGADINNIYDQMVMSGVRDYDTLVRNLTGKGNSVRVLNRIVNAVKLIDDYPLDADHPENERVSYTFMPVLEDTQTNYDYSKLLTIIQTEVDIKGYSSMHGTRLFFRRSANSYPKEPKSDIRQGCDSVEFHGPFSGSKNLRRNGDVWSFDGTLVEDNDGNAEHSPDKLKAAYNQEFDSAYDKFMTPLFWHHFFNRPNGSNYNKTIISEVPAYDPFKQKEIIGKDADRKEYNINLLDVIRSAIGP